MVGVAVFVVGLAVCFGLFWAMLPKNNKRD